MHTATLKFWNEERGYGFLKNDMGGDDFLHASALREAGIDSMTLHEGITLRLRSYAVEER